MWWVGGSVAMLIYLATAGAPRAASAEQVAALYGEPEVTKFKGGRAAAFSMQFDDSLESQATFAIPELNKRGLVGTFFINPGRSLHQKHREVWETVCPRFGHELANHTVHHRGAKDFEEADREIGECARYIWKLYPNKSKLRPFLGGGGTTWNIRPEQFRELMKKYYLFVGFDFKASHSALIPPEFRGRRVSESGIPAAPPRVGVSEERGNGRCVTVAEEAVREGKWAQVGFHGIGAEWISTSREHFLELVDYLAANKDKIWVATTGEVYRYCQERDAVKSIVLSAASPTGFDLSIECDNTRVETYGRPFTELYDEPLTVRVEVPASWTHFTVTQCGETKHYEALEVGTKRFAQFDVRPGDVEVRFVAEVRASS